MSKIICLLLTILFTGHFAISQEYQSKKDTVYIFMLKGTLDNGRPVTTFLAKNNLAFLKAAFEKKTSKEIVCTAISQSILFEEPALSFHYKRYQFKSIPGADAYYERYLQDIEPMSKSYVPFVTPKLSDGKYLHIYVTKISGDFWVLHFDSNSFYSETFPINNCYNWDKWYNLKKLDKIFPITRAEQDSIRKFIGAY